MPSGKVHYEIFVKKHRKAGWSLAEARPDREDAIEYARTLLQNLPTGSVRVSKERFDEGSRTFRSTTIFEEGAERFAVDEDKTGDGSLPCVSPDDLTNASARDTMRRVLSEWFVRKQLTPMELMHCPDHAEDLESGGTELQHAIQKVAVASARDGDSTVHAYVKQLNDLTQQAFDRIYKDGKTKNLPRFSDYKSYSALIDAFVPKQSLYKIRAALSDRLADERSYGKKLRVLMEFAGDLPADPAARALALEQLDMFASEILDFDSGLSAIIGSVDELGDEVQRLADMFDGSANAESLSGAPAEARTLTGLMKDGNFSACRAVIAAALLERLRRPRRLRPADVMAEVKLARKLAQKLVVAQGPDLSAESLQDAFAKRSARLLTPETIGDFLEKCDSTDQEIDQLLALEENIVGEQNKRKLAGYIRATLGTHKTESWFVSGEGRPVDRLHRLTAFQNRALSGNYPAEDKASLSDAFDGLGMKIIERSNLLETIASGSQPVLDRAASLLKLVTCQAIPAGKCAAAAQQKAVRLIRSDAGLEEARADTDREKLSGIEQMLKSLAKDAA
ncbi:hypothetical protein V0U79_11410 [Hyphobacterium sp. HN65]|uniref:Uncharacterized protein n=1 Tax=Hyphobacterium lacteum TaxID=3116575 RepID=A0ABU7LSV7_9PROT|nr:hypothetical protein [Hyphobacterium sp. HN65]MEE2526978.1 hypothetical protein [Hyphobacterium sp. HN65]